ncbi:hypothetical protein [Desulfosporosinus shakirovi]|uniref:hypothetical protein n=1 Tax=Desulfosporosinus shakirovi TaxID=2885154 RepID=UPI001E6369C1|nr:hypothetical protein [Desulfosporosinus sp. SRJS8]MCB8817389.1 hypothetical protein [Desulfosporosinus sp. SRJS8]
MNKSRKIKLNKNYTPLPTSEGDEIYPNGIFDFSISRILEYIAEGKLEAEEGRIEVKEWFEIRGGNI